MFLSLLLLCLSLFVSVIKRQVSVREAHEYCFIIVLLSLDFYLFVLRYPGQLQMLFGAIINLRNGFHADPFSNTLEMSLLLGFPYIRPPYYFY